MLLSRHRFSGVIVVSVVLFAAPLAMSCSSSASTAQGDASTHDVVPKADATTGEEGGPDAKRSDADGDTASPYPAPHPAMPRVVNFGGPVLATPNVIPIF